MQFATTFLLGASFVGAAFAQSQIAFTSLPSAVQAGVPFTLRWGGGQPDLPVTLTLKNGTSANLLYVATIAGRATGTSYDWTPSSSLTNGEYALEIAQGLDNINYSGQFTLSGGAPATTGITSSSSASSTSSSSSTAPSTGSSTSSSASSGITPIVPIPIPVPTGGSNNTAATTTTSTGNATVSITTQLPGTGVFAGASGAGGSIATGTVMDRNTTMSMATLSSTSDSSTSGSSTGPSSTNAGSTTKSSTSSTQKPSSTPTGAAIRLGSPVALVLSVFAAVVYLG